MAEFRYTARQMDGTSVAGAIAAGSMEEATRLLRQQSLFPIKIDQARSMSAMVKPRAGRRIGARILAQFYSQLSDLLHSGVPLLKSLDILERQTVEPRLREVLVDLRKRVADGEGLSKAMKHHEAVFGELACSMVLAGEEGGFLEDVFKRIAIFAERQEDLKAKVVGALAYPVILMAIGGSVVAILLVYFVPQFATIFDRLRERGELPMLTEVLLNFSALLQSYLWLVAIVAGIVIWQVRQHLSTPAGRRFADQWKFRLPIVGPVIRDLAITRFNRVLGTLRKNGIPILNALRIAKDSTGNVLMAEAIEQAAQSVQSGDKLATPLRLCGFFPPEIVEMIAVAEESNTVEQVLLDTAESLEARTTRNLDLAVKFLEPVMLVAMASVVLVVVIALLLPIFKMSKGI